MTQSTIKRNQGGFTLVSLLVGIVLCMITMLGILTAYKAIVINAKSSMASAKANNVSATLSVFTARYLQQAGWGVGATNTPMGARANTDFILLKDAKLLKGELSGTALPIGTTTQQGTAAVWTSAMNGALQCYGLFTAKGGVTRLGPVNCTSASQWSSLDWGTGQSMAPDGTFPTPVIQVLATKCWPYGGGPGPQPALAVSLQNIGTNSASVCLTNFPS